MKKLKSLLLLITVLIILICLAIFIRPQKDKEVAPDASSTPQSNIEVIHYTNKQLTKLSITEGEQTLTFIQKDNAWVIDGLDSSANMNTAAIKVLCDNLLTLDASKKIDSANLTDFGLDKPTKIVTYTLVDGTTSKILFGDSTPDDRNVYILKESSHEIFLLTTSMADSFSGDLTKYRTTELDKIDTATVSNLIASGKDIESFNIYLNTNTSDYTTSYLLKLGDGSLRDVSTNNFMELLKLIPSPITIENFVADDVQDLSVYGLDHPTLDLYVKNVTSETDPTSKKAKDVVTEIHYLWGNTAENNQVYFMKAGTNNIYSMDSNFLNPLLTAFDSFNLSAKFTQLTNIADVTSIDVTFPNESYTLKIDGDAYTLNGKKLSSDTFKNIYRNIIGISADTEFKDTALPNNSPAISFLFTSPEGEKTTYNYYNYDKQFYQTQFKGQSVVGCNIKQFNYLKESLDKALAETTK